MREGFIDRHPERQRGACVGVRRAEPDLPAPPTPSAPSLSLGMTERSPRRRPPPISTLPFGCSLSAPSVTTCSPSLTPLTTDIVPSLIATCTGRICAVFWAVTT